MNVEKEITQLKDKVNNLEKNKKNIISGSSYNNIGTSSSDFLIKTRGKVKIQCGSKFIDLIKDGKINADSKFIYKENEIGVKDGIYVLEDEENTKVVLQINGIKIDLKDPVGSTYVSFLGEQNISSDKQYLALSNIGFIYPNLETAKSKNIKKGIIYIEDSKQLYIIQDGKFTEYESNLKIPYNNPIIISPLSKQNGAIQIQGTGLSNGILFDSLCIYTENDSGYINTNKKLKLLISNASVASFEKDIITFITPIKSNNIYSNKIQSEQIESDSGYKLYYDESSNQSTLEIDNLVVRNQIIQNDQQISLNSQKLNNEYQTNLPTGSIIMFNPQINNIPDNWVICNGENNTPDLTSNFIENKSKENDEDQSYSLIYIMKIS